MSSCRDCDSTIPSLRFPGPVDKEHIRKLLRSNSEPPGAALRPTISALADELQRYKDEIAKLETRLEALKTERAVFQAHHDDCRSLHAPIRRLPSEIMAEIFASCWTVRGLFDVEKKTFSTEIERLANLPLLILSQVCIRWHRIEMGTPS
ncbi:hypothetical protein B0H14DRAFT_3614405 [Mycena olivaceomarginata]|nr:hypothetical protein B0H14DRAFT_3614405 [Mycena olivaceomarginata]